MKHLRLTLSALLCAAVLPTLRQPSFGEISLAPHSGPAHFCAAVFAPPSSSFRPLALAKLPAADTLPEPVVIEAMFLYTPQAREGAGSEAKVRQAIFESIEHTNFIFTNSQVNVRIEPIYIGEIAYTESGDMDTDLRRLTNGEGALNRAVALRSAYKADIVCLVAEHNNNGFAGMAWLSSETGNAAYGFTVVLRQRIGKHSYLLAHEFGHLLGCAHDREHAGDLNDAWYKAARPYIFGHRFVVDGVTYVDAMGYPPGVRLPSFSNPRMDLDGVAMGVAVGDLPSDISRTINETAPYVAAYLTAASRIQFDASEYRVNKISTNITLKLRRSGDLNTSVRVPLTVDPQSTARAGIDFIRPGVMTVQFATNQAEAVFEIPLVQHDVPEPAKTLLLSLGLPSPNSHGIGWQGTTRVYIDDIPPVVRFSGEPLAVLEQNGTIEIQPEPIEQLDTLEAPRVTWRIESDTALAGKHYVAATGELTYTRETIPGGVRLIPHPIAIQLLDDLEPEADKVLRVVFDTAPRLVGDRQVNYLQVTNEVRIVDNDRIGSILRVPGVGLNLELNAPAYAGDTGLNVAVRHDGKMLLLGGFDQLRGIERTAMALLNADGSVDESFQPPILLSGHRAIERLERADIRMIRFLPDSKMLVSGTFARVNGKPSGSLIRLKEDGTLDETFGKGLSFDGSVSASEILPDGKYVIGGRFKHVNGERRSFLVRLHPDGTVDESFQPKGGPTSSLVVDVISMALQPGGQLLIGGFFEKYDGEPALNVARIDPNGTLDRSFKLKNASGRINHIAPQADGRIILAGAFERLGSRNSPKIARIHPDGSADLSFVSPRPNGEVYSCTALPDGRLVVQGGFTRIGNSSRRFVAVLNANGTLNTEFDLGAGPGAVPGFSIHDDGTIYLSGDFEKVSNVAAPNLVAVKLGPPGTAISRAWINEQREFVLRPYLFPGSYKVEAGSDLSGWAEVDNFTAEWPGQAGDIKLPLNRAHEFFRIRSEAK
jgi:uncharacterized delta-60 repeat protein